MIGGHRHGLMSGVKEAVLMQLESELHAIANTA